MKKVELRRQRVSDAKKFYEILSNPNFVHFSACPKSVEDEKKYLRGNAKKRKENIEHNFTILYNGKIVGGIGVKVDIHRPYIGEIGYFIDEKFWSKGICSRAVRLVEKIAKKDFKMKRVTIIMEIPNIGSRRVAEKCGYVKEGICKKVILNKKKYRDCYLFAKIL